MRLFHLVLPLMAGILIGWCSREVCCAYWYVSFCACVIASIALFYEARRKQKLYSKRFVSVVYVTFFLLGVTLLLFHYHNVKKSWWQGDSVAQGIVVSVPKEHAKTSSAVVQVLFQKQGNDVSLESRKIMLTWLNDSTQKPPQLGEAWMFYGKITEPQNNVAESDFDYASWLYGQGISGVAFAGTNYKKCAFVTQQHLMQRLTWWERLKLCTTQKQQSLSGMLSKAGISGEEYAILSALSLGDKQHITKEIRTLFSSVGASHVLALSGLHLGILVSILMLLLHPLLRSRWGKVLTAILCIGMVWSFAPLTGLNVSIVRSAIMYSMFMLLYVRNQENQGLQNLLIAALLILFFQPMALLDVGFQLSFLSVFFILFLQPYYQTIRPKQRWISWAADFVYVSVVAQVATAPLVAYTFHVLPVWFLLSNVVVIPCAYVLLSGALLFFVLQIVPVASFVVAQGLICVVKIMLQGLRWVGSLPVSHIEFFPSAMTCILCYVLMLAFWWMYARQTLKRLCIFIGILTLFLGSFVSSGYRYHTEGLEKYYTSVCGVQFFVNNHRSYLWLGSAESKEKVKEKLHAYWGKRHMAEPQILHDGYKDANISMQKGIVAWNGKCFVFVDNNKWRNMEVVKPLEVDELYIAKGCYMEPEELQALFCAKKVTLSANLPAFMRQKYQRYYQSNKIIVHNLSMHE